MSILRYEPTTQDRVIVAPGRSRRPHDAKPTAPDDRTSAAPCPFCPGNERLTGPEIRAVRSGTPANAPGWSIRVVPNRFPALAIEADIGRVEEGPLFRHMGGCGAHEVIIESPERAGTSLRHPHGQLIASPVVPGLCRRKHIIAGSHFDATGNCIYCDLLAAEIENRTRVVASNADDVASFRTPLTFRSRLGSSRGRISRRSAGPTQNGYHHWRRC